MAATTPDVRPAQRPDPPKAPELAEVYQAEFDYVWRTLRRLGIPDADLEDRVHDVFVIVHRKLDEFDPARSIRAWLFGIAFRVAANARRRARPTWDVDVDAIAGDAPRGDERVADREGWRLLVAALDAVELDRRAVIVLHDLDGHTAPEVAETLGIPLNTVYSRLRVARQELSRAVTRLRGRP